MRTTEKIVRDALEGRGVRFVFHGEHRGPKADKLQKGLDFFLPDHAVYIECKDYHSDRIAGQMARDENVIAIQGTKSAELFAKLISEENVSL